MQNDDVKFKIVGKKGSLTPFSFSFFVAAVLMLGGLFVFFQTTFAQMADTCPGSDPVSLYSCQTTDNNYASGGCLDIFTDNYTQTVICYPNDLYESSNSHSGGCGGLPNGPNCDNSNSKFSCSLNDLKRCEDKYGVDSNWGVSTCKTRWVNCYPDDTTTNLTGALNQPCNSDGTCGSNLQCDQVAGRETSNTCILLRACELNTSGPEWTEVYKPKTGGSAYGYGTAVDAAGNVYETGEAFNASTTASGLDVFLRKYSSDGGLLWEKVYDNGGNESGYGVAVSGSGVYVAGRMTSMDYRGDMFVLGYD